MLKPILRTVAARPFVALSSIAHAYDLPGLNLGSPSSYDGSPAPAGPGWYLEEYLTYSRASRFNDANGHKLALPRQDLDVVAPTTQTRPTGADSPARTPAITSRVMASSGVAASKL